jgi:hypothetical protein
MRNTFKQVKEYGLKGSGKRGVDTVKIMADTAIKKNFTWPEQNRHNIQRKRVESYVQKSMEHISPEKRAAHIKNLFSKPTKNK